MRPTRVQLRDSRGHLYGIYILDEDVIEIKRGGVIAQFSLAYVRERPMTVAPPSAVFTTLERPAERRTSSSERAGDDAHAECAVR